MRPTKWALPAVTLLAAVAAIAAQPIPNDPFPPIEEPPGTRLDRLLDRAQRHLTRVSLYSCANRRTRSRFLGLSDQFIRVEARASALLGHNSLAGSSTSSCTTLYDHRRYSFHAARADYLLRRAERMIRRGETN